MDIYIHIYIYAYYKERATDTFLYDLGNLTHSSFASVGFLICHQKPQSSCNFSLGIHNY